MKQIRADLGLKVEGIDGVFCDLFPFFFMCQKLKNIEMTEEEELTIMENQTNRLHQFTISPKIDKRRRDASG